MADLLSAVVAVALLVAAGLAGLYAVTVVPFVLAVDLAERRRRSTGRWAGWALAAVLLGLALAAVAWLGGAGAPAVVLALGVGFLPAVLLRTRGDRLGGPAGRHESPL